MKYFTPECREGTAGIQGKSLCSDPVCWRALCWRGIPVQETPAWDHTFDIYMTKLLFKHQATGVTPSKIMPFDN